jgi:hypothetical protein
MKFSDETIQAIMSSFWAKTPVKLIARSNHMTQRDVRQVIAVWTLRHHGQPATRQSMGLEKLSECG